MLHFPLVEKGRDVGCLVLTKSSFNKNYQMLLIFIRRQNTLNYTHAKRSDIVTTLVEPNAKDKKKSWGIEPQ